MHDMDQAERAQLRAVDRRAADFRRAIALHEQQRPQPGVVHPRERGPGVPEDERSQIFARFNRGASPFSALERWQTGYLPVYGIWAAIVVFALPPMFSFA